MEESGERKIESNPLSFVLLLPQICTFAFVAATCSVIGTDTWSKSSAICIMIFLKLQYFISAGILRPTQKTSVSRNSLPTRIFFVTF